MIKMYICLNLFVVILFYIEGCSMIKTNIKRDKLDNQQVFDPLTRLIAEILVDNVLSYTSDVLITYKDVSKKTGNKVYPIELRSYLYTISNTCKEHNMPLLSAIVVNSDDLFPGHGFFEAYLPGLDEKTQMKEWFSMLNEIKEYKNWNRLLHILGKKN